MGNSQSAQLHTNSVLLDSRYKKEISRINKYASPECKVLPGPIKGQKLKNTDNGNILLNGGTISGRKFDKFSSFEDSDPEVLAFLNRRSALLSSRDESFHKSKRFYSDPDLSSNSLSKGNSRTDINVHSPSKERINRAKRKKSKAPAPAPPPVNLSTLPTDLEKVQKYRRHNDRRKINVREYQQHEPTKRNGTKSPAPKPPQFEQNSGRKLLSTLIVPNAPIPPPLPESFVRNPSGSRLNGDSEIKLNNLNKVSGRLQTMENIRPNVNLKRQNNQKIAPNDRFCQNLQDDIKAAVQKRLSSSDEIDKRRGQLATLKQYYFAGSQSSPNTKARGDDKLRRSDDDKSDPKPPQQYYFGANASDVAGKAQSKPKNKDLKKAPTGIITKAIIERTFATSDSVVAETKRFECSPNQKRRSRREQFMDRNDDKLRSWHNIDAPNNSRSKFKSGIYNRQRSISSSSSECDLRIRIDLRPMVPAKRSQNLPKFSPTQAWRSLSFDSVARDVSNEPSSDETNFGESGIVGLNRANDPNRRSIDKSGDSGIIPDVDITDHQLKHRSIGDNERSDSSNQKSISRNDVRQSTEQKRGQSKSQWTPEQDLSDDCCDSPTFGKPSTTLGSDPVMVNVQPKLVTPAAFSSMPYLNYTQYPASERELGLNEDIPMSPSERVKEKSKRGVRKRSKSTKTTKNENSQPSSLQNFKNSMISALSINRKSNYDDKVDSANWSLSRSIPNSLNELCFDEKPELFRGRDPLQNSKKPSYISSFQENPELLLFDDNYRSLPQLNRLEKSGMRQGHVVYLPEYKTVQVPGSHKRNQSKSRDSKLLKELEENSDRSKQPYNYDDKRKLWFMSTMAKEMQERNNERQPDWMNRVEEEFKSKRDREKANIRQQLRILNLEYRRSNISVDELGMNSSDSQSPETPTFDYRRHMSKSEDDLSKSPNFKEGRKQTRSRSYHELREDPSEPHLMPLIPPPPKNSLPSLDFFLDKTRYRDRFSTSSPTSSSHASYTKQELDPTKGVSKWLRKNTKEEDLRHSLTSLRPDPEGCRSSSEENKESFENDHSYRKSSEGYLPAKRQSIYKQLNQIAESEEKLKERSPLDEQNPFPRLNSSGRMNSAGESYSESDIEVRNSSENLSRSRSGHNVASKDSITSSEDGHMQSGFYSNHKMPSGGISKQYSEYKDNYEQKKIPFMYAQPFTPSKGYRPVSFNPTIKPFVK